MKRQAEVCHFCGSPEERKACQAEEAIPRDPALQIVKPKVCRSAASPMRWTNRKRLDEVEVLAVFLDHFIENATTPLSFVFWDIVKKVFPNVVKRLPERTTAASVRRRLRA